MLDTSLLLGFVTTALVVIVVPGPGVLFIVSRGVSLGRRAALLTVFGHFVGLMVQVAAVAAGLGAILERSIVAFTLVKFVGAAYLIWLGWQALKRRHQLAHGLDTYHVAASPRRVLRDGFVVGVSNPKGFALFASVLPQFVDPSLGHVGLQMLLLGLICGAMALVSDSIWGIAAGSARSWLSRSPRRLAAVGGTGGIVTIGLGIRLAATGRHD
jgi:threonine/homoserine/homoserine lactone efflux protein